MTKWTMKDRWEYALKPWFRYRWCRLVGHRDFRSIKHYEICEYNHSGMIKAHPDHDKGGVLGETIDGWCTWCDYGWMDENGKYKE